MQGTDQGKRMNGDEIVGLIGILGVRLYISAIKKIIFCVAVCRWRAQESHSGTTTRPRDLLLKGSRTLAFHFNGDCLLDLETDEGSDTIATFKVQRTIALLERCFLLRVELALESPEYWLSDSCALKVRGPSCV